MLDDIFRFLLAFSHEAVLVPFIIIGYIWLDRNIFFHVTCLVLISMLFNLALKASFQVPLSPILGKEGFAFPSGHMQLSIVFYGWLFKSTHTLALKMMIILLLVAIAFGLVHFGYHNYFDILGAIFFGLLLIFVYSFFLKRIRRELLSIIVLCFCTVLMVYIGLIYQVKEYAWMAYYALIGFICSEWYLKNKKISKSYKSKMIATLFCAMAFALFNILFSVLTLPTFLSQLKLLFLGLSIPFSLYFPTILKFKTKMMG